MKTLLIATRNKGKLKEFKSLLESLPYELKTLDDVNINVDVDETGNTYEENAILKAKEMGEKSGLLTLGEDSGLEIDELNGWPGIKSARHTKGTDQDRIDVIIEKVKKIPINKRNACYVSVVAVYDPKTKEVKTFESKAEGKMLDQMVGENGFGYDPIFWSNDLEKTFAQSSQEEKNKVGHRGKAVTKSFEYLQSKN